MTDLHIQILGDSKAFHAYNWFRNKYKSGSSVSCLLEHFIILVRLLHDRSMDLFVNKASEKMRNVLNEECRDDCDDAERETGQVDDSESVMVSHFRTLANCSKNGVIHAWDTAQSRGSSITYGCEEIRETATGETSFRDSGGDFLWQEDRQLVSEDGDVDAHCVKRCQYG